MHQNHFIHNTCSINSRLCYNFTEVLAANDGFSSLIGSIPVQPMETRLLMCLNKCFNFMPVYIVNMNVHLCLLVKVIINYGLWIKRIRIVLVQLDISRR